jgi:hypothetical protein
LIIEIIIATKMSVNKKFTVGKNSASQGQISTSKGDGNIPTYMKYQKNLSGWVNPSSKLKPSELMSQTVLEVVAEDYPMIIEFINMKDNSAQVHSVVDIDEPLFQPSPSVMIFEDYAPFAVHEKKLFFRNSDKVNRCYKWQYFM